MNGAVTALSADNANLSAENKSIQKLGIGQASNYIYCVCEDNTEYIDAVYVCSGDNVFDVCSELVRAGATRAVLYDVRHNTRVGSTGNVKYTLIGYSMSKPTKTGIRTRANGVRDIVIVKAEDESGVAPSKLELDGLEYKPARNGNGVPEAVNAADGMYIYYYTSATDKVRPLINKLGISERDRVPDTKELWENVLTSDNKRYNLNEGIFTFKDGTQFLTDSRAYLYCKRQDNVNNYVKPGAAIVGGHCEESVTYGELYLEPAG